MSVVVSRVFWGVIVAGASRARIRYTAIEHGDCVAITNASTQSCGKRRQKSNPRTLVLYAASQLRATIVRDHRNADVTRRKWSCELIVEPAM
jgi:hypothetical protein